MTLAPPRPQDEIRFEEGFRPHKGARGYMGQEDWLDAALVFNVVCLAMGRRAGKTTTIHFLLLDEIARAKRYYQAAYMAQGHPQAKDMFRAILDVWSKANMVKASHADEGQDRWIETHAINECPGAKVWFVSGEQGAHTGFHGKGLDRAILDEASLVPEEAWTMTLSPMLADGGGGKAVIIGSPIPGEIGFDWFEQMWLSGEVGGEKRQKGRISFNAPTECNPTLSTEVIARLRATAPSKEIEMCLYDGVFARASGVVFPNLKDVFVLPFTDRGGCWVHEEYNPKIKYVAGLDFGAKKDYSVLSILTMEEIPRQVFLLRIQGDLHRQMGTIDAWLAAYGHPLLYVEGQEGGRFIAPMLRERYGEGCREVRWTRGGEWDKESAVLRGVDFFQQKGWKLIDVQWQFDEFRMFSRSARSLKNPHSTGFNYSAPPGKHDDAVAATLYAAYGLPRVAQRLELEPEPEAPKVGTWARWKMLQETQQRVSIVSGYGKNTLS